MGSSRVLSFEFLFAVVLLAITGVVAERSGSIHDHPSTRSSHGLQKVEVVNVGDGPFLPISVPVGTKFQLAILENGEVLYLYSEGEKVLKTNDPDSVGTARTIWESVFAIAPAHEDWENAFKIQNTDTGAALLYDGDFYGTWEPVIANWRLFQSPHLIEPPQFLLRYLPHSRNGFIPGVFWYLPIGQDDDSSSEGDAGLYFDVIVDEGTRFQLILQGEKELLYLYSEGEKVLTTADPDSVGTARTIWESVPGFAPLIEPYTHAFAIQNTDTKAVLSFDGDFVGIWSEPPVRANWRLFQSPLRIFPPQFKLRYVPLSTNGFIPGVFWYRPIGQDDALVIKTAA